MPDSPSWQPTKAFWLAYAIAWLPYLTGLMLVFNSEQANLVLSFFQAGPIILPLALTGVGLVWAVRKVPWDPHAKQHFFAMQIGLGITFIFVTLFLISFFGSLLEWRYSGQFQLKLITPVTPLIIFNNLLIFCSISAITYGLQLAVSLRFEAERVTQAEMLRTQAELQAMRAQLNPHFLFNTLHSLQALVRIAPNRAEDALDQFGALMRYPLRLQDHAADLVPLAEEWEFIRNYLELEKLRFENRLRFEADLAEDCLDCMLPALTLQPLIENAIRHAVEPSSIGATIRLSVKRSGEQLTITLGDDGPGCEPESWQNATGIGLRVARKRIEVRFAEQAAFSVTTSPGQGFTIRITLPAIVADDT